MGSPPSRGRSKSSKIRPTIYVENQREQRKYIGIPSRSRVGAAVLICTEIIVCSKVRIGSPGPPMFGHEVEDGRYSEPAAGMKGESIL